MNYVLDTGLGRRHFHPAASTTPAASTGRFTVADTCYIRFIHSAMYSRKGGRPASSPFSI